MFPVTDASMTRHENTMLHVFQPLATDISHFLIDVDPAKNNAARQLGIGANTTLPVHKPADIWGELTPKLINYFSKTTSEALNC